LHHAYVADAAIREPIGISRDDRTAPGWVYLAAIVMGLFIGLTAPSLSNAMEALLWPELTTLFVAFTQVVLLVLCQSAR
jgi:hypothetical protein